MRFAFISILFIIMVPTILHSQHVVNFTIPECPTTVAEQFAPSDNSLLLYPNPASGIFYFKIQKNEKEFLPVVEVFDMMGNQQYVSVLSIHPDLMQIDIRLLAKGVYMVKITSKHECFQKSLIVY
ncbi:MAG: hypothetical protein BWY70_01157 [Bacteroidetes bacterium ADurb.Bin408]|nr:MAG: hypothetical protein BWY70_01157 [Bacteroidetes bacterium ADurb.Bin408]